MGTRWSCCRRRDRCRGKQRRRRGGDDDDDNTNPGTPGNPSDPDTTPPNAPSNLQFSSDGKTVTGTAEPGSTITLKDADGNLVGTGKTGSDGKFTIVLSTPLTNGEQLTATATDSSGNTSQAGHVTAPDTTAPDAPDIVIVNDDVGGETGPLTNGQRTDDARPTFSGIGEAGSTITLYDNGQPIGKTKVDASGNWTFTRVQISLTETIPLPPPRPTRQVTPAQPPAP